MDTILEHGVTLITLLQAMGDGFIALMKFFTFLGNEEFYLLFLPLLYWCVDTALGLRVGLAVLLGGILNTYFKWIFHLPRPFWYSNKVTAHAVETSSFGVPSGHSQNAVTVWGLVASYLGKPWAWLIATILMFGIGLSRMVLGVHFYVDVLSGWLLGIVILWAILKFEKPVINWLGEKSTSAQIGVLFGISLGLLLVGKLILLLVGNWEIPAAWVQNVAAAAPDSEPLAPFAFSSLITTSAGFFGMAAGAVWMRSLGGFNPKGIIWKRVVRYVLGIVGVVIIFAGMKAIFPAGDDLVGYTFRYVRYALVSAWTSLFAPWIFIKAKLAEPARK
jgi:membrane-associated phospholipid phosphatase